MIWIDIARSANHPLALWPWGKDMSAARLQYKCSPRDFELENNVNTKMIFIFKKWNYLDHDQSDISGSMFAKLLQIVSEMCKFCVAIWCGVIYCQGPVIWCSLCVIQPLLNIYQADPICCPTLDSRAGWSLLKHSWRCSWQSGIARRLCQEPTSTNRLKEIHNHLDFALDELYIIPIVSSSDFDIQIFVSYQSIRSMFTTCIQCFRVYIHVD